MSDSWQLAILTYLVSVLFSFGVQYLVFLYYKSRKHPILDEHKHVAKYVSGIVGDGVLVPLTNVFIVLSLQMIPMQMSNSQLMLSLVMGYVITFIFHFGQTHYRLTNWTMPQVNHWNGLGL